MNGEIIAVDLDTSEEVRFTPAAFKLYKEKNPNPRLRIFKDEMELERWWRNHHPRSGRGKVS